MFSLTNQKLKLNNINVRAEKHGDENKLAADLKLSMKVSNDVLVHFHPSLRSFLFKEGDAAQSELPIDDEKRLTSLRFPNMGSISLSDEMAGYEFKLHYGIGGKSDIKLLDCQVDKFRFTPQEGGTVEASFRVIVHPQAAELGRMCELIQDDITITLTPPEEQQQDLQKAA